MSLQGARGGGSRPGKGRAAVCGREPTLDLVHRHIEGQNERRPEFGAVLSRLLDRIGARAEEVRVRDGNEEVDEVLRV